MTVKKYKYIHKNRTILNLIDSLTLDVWMKTLNSINFELEKKIAWVNLILMKFSIKIDL